MNLGGGSIPRKLVLTQLSCGPVGLKSGRSAIRRQIRASLGSSGPDAGEKKRRVRLRLPYRTDYGQCLCVSGEPEVLGAWREDSCLAMEWKEGHVWQAEFEAPEGESIEYKYILKQPDGSIQWQPSDNQILQIPDDVEDIVIDVSDNWLGNNHRISVENHQVREESIADEIPKGLLDIGAPKDAAEPEPIDFTLPVIENIKDEDEEEEISSSAATEELRKLNGGQQQKESVELSRNEPKD